jgi:hypothetical protein
MQDLSSKDKGNWINLDYLSFILDCAGKYLITIHSLLVPSLLSPIYYTPTRETIKRRK